MCWYLLFGGTSSDGRGEPRYIGRTSHKAVAKEHFEGINSNPYSTGKVMIANDFELKQASKHDLE
jgi:hypothetical protein